MLLLNLSPMMQVGTMLGLVLNSVRSEETASSSSFGGALDGDDSVRVFNSHSIYGYKKSDGEWEDLNWIPTDDSHTNFGYLSWQSLIECFPDNRAEKLDNYKNWACDGILADKNWSKTTELFPCGPDKDHPVSYFLEDLEGHQDPDDGTQSNADWYIACWYEDKGGQKWRNLEFPPGYFVQDEQVWIPPNTAVYNPYADPNESPNDGYQTYFLAMQDADKYNVYEDFWNNLPLADSYFGNQDHSGAPYCHPYSDYNPDTWYSGNDGWPNAKKVRIGFLMHTYTYLGRVNILGSDLVRPSENGSLCGGAAIETPGCISQYGKQTDELLGCFGDTENGLEIDYYTNYFNDHADGWVAGGINNWIDETNTYGGVTGITVDNVRFNDPEARNIDSNSKPGTWPASQVSFYIPGTPDGSYTTDVLLTGLVSLTTVADGLNIGGNVDILDIKNSAMQNTGDDAFGFWQNTGDQKLTLTDSFAKYPGIRGNTQYGSDPSWGFGSCISFFGCHYAGITNFNCWDRHCPSEDDNTPCGDSEQGHLITFYPPSWFEGHYDWNDENGKCMINVENIGWYYLDAPKTFVNQNDPIEGSAYGRKWISPFWDSGDIDDINYTEAWVTWDGNSNTPSGWGY